MEPPASTTSKALTTSATASMNLLRPRSRTRRAVPTSARAPQAKSMTEVSVRARTPAPAASTVAGRRATPASSAAATRNTTATAKCRCVPMIHGHDTPVAAESRTPRPERNPSKPVSSSGTAT